MGNSPPQPETDALVAPASQRRIALFGATGSIGESAVEVIQASKGRLSAVAISAHRRLDRLVQLAKQLKPRWVIATDRQAADAHRWRGLPKESELLVGHAALEQVAREPQVDTVLAGLVGIAGMHSTLAAVQVGKDVALANKETMVAAGPMVGPLLAKHGGRVLPVDSEHSAIFQALQCGTTSEVARLVITASGGPFRNWDSESLRQVTVDEALSHPTWSMGPKITIDSATLMNKALEIVEARWLFDLPAERIKVMIHPQSIVHSMVEFVDGSVIAQMSPPDMRLPIQYALEYPHRREAVAPRFDWKQQLQLEFEPADLDRYPAIELGFRAARQGGTAGVVVNAANEAAVAQFLAGELHFTEIVPACSSVLDSHNFSPNPTLEDLLSLDKWARREVENWVCA